MSRRLPLRPLSLYLSLSLSFYLSLSRNAHAHLHCRPSIFIRRPRAVREYLHLVSRPRCRLLLLLLALCPSRSFFLLSRRAHFIVVPRRAKMCHVEQDELFARGNCYVRERPALVKSICTGQTSSAYSYSSLRDPLESYLLINVAGYEPGNLGERDALFRNDWLLTKASREASSPSPSRWARPRICKQGGRIRPRKTGEGSVLGLN